MNRLHICFMTQLHVIVLVRFPLGPLLDYSTFGCCSILVQILLSFADLAHVTMDGKLVSMVPDHAALLLGRCMSFAGSRGGYELAAESQSGSWSCGATRPLRPGQSGIISTSLFVILVGI